VSELEQLKKAYEILGLPDDATREQVENRYFILIKRARSDQSRHETSDNSTIAPDLAEVNRAYNLVLGIESEKTGTIKKQSKLAHFMYYYKLHLIVSIVVVLVAGYMIKEGIDKRNAAANLPPSSLSVSLFGNFYFVKADILEKNLLKLVPEWKRINTTLIYLPSEIKTPQDMAMQQKSVLLLMTESSELYILDAKNFSSLASQGVFKRLDGLDGWAALNVAPDQLRYAQTTEDTSPVPYGIDITGNPVFEGIDISGERQIVAVRSNEEKWNDTRKLLEKLIQTTPKS
jgi:hypothetical protein